MKAGTQGAGPGQAPHPGARLTRFDRERPWRCALRKCARECFTPLITLAAVRCNDCGRRQETSETSNIHVCETERGQRPVRRDEIWWGLLAWVRAIRPYLEDHD